MKCEIGSNFWEYCINSPRQEAFWWERGSFDYQYFKSGRNAALALCNHISNTVEKKVILAPAYLCETEIDPWRISGWKVQFFQINMDFSIDEISLQKQLELLKPSVILIQSYYGFNTISDEVFDIIERYKSEKTIVVEDVTHCIFSDPACSTADFYVGSLRKFFAIPDGGLVIAKNWTQQVVVPTDQHYIEVAHKAFSMKTDYFITKNPMTKKLFRNYYVELSKYYADNNSSCSMSDFAKRILDTLNMGNIREKRQRNYNYLLNLLRSRTSYCITLQSFCGKDVPLYLPIYCDTEQSRIKIRSKLASQDIYCPVLWNKLEHYAIEYPESLKIYERILCIPIDQRYELDDMDRIVNALGECEK